MKRPPVLRSGHRDGSPAAALAALAAASADAVRRKVDAPFAAAIDARGCESLRARIGSVPARGFLAPARRRGSRAISRSTRPAAADSTLQEDTMRGMIAIVATGAMLVVASAASAQDARPMPAYAFFTPPIGNVDLFVDNTFEASFVSTGTAPVKLTIQLCTLAGACTSPGFACVGVPLTRGTGCSTGNLVADEPLYAKFRVQATGGGTIDGMGSLRVIGPDGANSAAVQTHTSVPDRVVTEQ